MADPNGWFDGVGDGGGDLLLEPGKKKLDVRLDVASGESVSKPDERADDAAPIMQREKPKTPPLRFACPFAKQDPEKYKNVKACSGPGWPAVHRVKWVNSVNLSISLYLVLPQQY